MAIIKSFQPTLPDLEKIGDVNLFFLQVKEKFSHFLEKNYFTTIHENVMVVHRVQNEQGDFVGLSTCVDVEEYLAGNIVRHELTLEEKERTIMALTLERQAFIKPTMLTYLKIQEITDLLLKLTEKYPIYHQINFLKEKHSFYLIKKEKHLKKLTDLFQQHLSKVYIADGHHRFATAANLYKRNSKRRYFLASLFGSDQLEINEFNRIISTLNGLTPQDFIVQLSQSFAITKLHARRKAQRVQEIVMYLSNEWYSLQLRDEEIARLKTLPLAKRLDVSILNRLIIKEILGICDVRSDAQVKYAEGIKSLSEIEKKVNKNSEGVGFALYPISGKSFIDVSDAGETLPPKSTFFTPRMRNGFVVQRF